MTSKSMRNSIYLSRNKARKCILNFKGLIKINIFLEKKTEKGQKAQV